MKFISIAFENFMSFRKRQVLPLDDLGLVLIKGDNRLSGATDSNGVGKTAIFDALSWALFGQTLRGLRADDVACRFSKGACLVGLLMEIDGKKWAIKRGRRPNLLEVRHSDGKSWVEVPDEFKKDTQVKIEDVLGFGFRTFRNATVFGQGVFERFSTASQAEQMQMIDEIQQLDLSHAFEKAREWRDKARERVDKIDTNLGGLVSKLAALEQQVQSLGRSKGDFAASKQRSVDEADQALTDAKDEEGKANESLHKLAGRVQDVKAMVTELELVTELKAKLDNSDLDLRDMRTEKVSLEERLGDVEAKVRELIGAGRCPECRVRLRGEALTEMKQAFAPDLKDVQAKLSVLERKLNPAMQERSHAVQRYKDTEKRLRIKHQLESLQQVAEMTQRFSPSVLEREKKLHESLLGRVREASSVLERERVRNWEGEAPLELARRSLADAEHDQEVLKAERLMVKDALEMAEYWVEGFGNRGIRSLMFDSVADFLNRRITDHLEILTGGEATVRFSALSALKKGGVKEKISIESSWSWGAKGSSGASAGQGRRIDLAIFGALQDLAEQRSARPFPVRIWDEAGDSLDSRGKEIFAEWARVEARRSGTGFVITHDREFGEILEPDYIWTVVMNKDGSSEVVVE